MARLVLGRPSALGFSPFWRAINGGHLFRNSPSRFWRAFGTNMVQPLVICCGDYLQIFYRIVEAITIFVVNMLGFFQSAIYVALHNKPMFPDITVHHRVRMVLHSNQHISGSIDSFSPKPCGVVGPSAFAFRGLADFIPCLLGHSLAFWPWHWASPNAQGIASLDLGGNKWR